MKNLIVAIILISLQFNLMVFGQRQNSENVPNPKSLSIQQKVLKNNDIIRMVRARIDEKIIINAINSTQTQFNVSVDGLIELKKAGVSKTIVQAMQASMTGEKPFILPNSNKPLSSVDKPLNSSLIPSKSDQELYAILVEGTNKRILPPTSAHIVKTKTKKKNLASIAKDEAVSGAISRVANEAAVRTGIAMGGAAASLPLISSIIGGGIFLGGLLRKKRTITLVTALDGQSSSNVLKTNTPKFEVVYANIAGVNPDEFEPVIVKLVPTSNNYRLAYARKIKEGKPFGKFYEGLTEERMPSRVIKLERGYFQIQAQALPVGEYALVLRPISQDKEFSVKNQSDFKSFGITLIVWDFTITN